ncbi:carbon monoxide dehydrogenase [Modestobacter sp. I12A-02628]|uniref:Carbon monoxide dehydrogenase n=1 Tax=Goekera deserti TaxID=2497753 RepID=A0A7K3WA84_9ACTN|nr:SRPBCC family protein [Goekera deserti]MPQ98937.1 carbon monoxide dehydrogenase [Goekera deserti]NDI49563.1 carbon monoxide dehydrogenase [Goekera deserti]NEL53244.1 carbon monoxide dehydrogenase [Goekera deserti]
MQLENSFTVPLPIDEAWRVLLDIDRIAPCMPGAALDSVDGDDFTGRVKVKLGPINLTYAGKGSFIEKDEAAHRAVIDARGKDQRGNGTAAAIVTATLAAEGTSTRVDVLTDLNITGRPAQFGRGVMTDVGNKLLGQFADKLAAQLGEGDAQGDADRAAAAASSPAESPAVAASSPAGTAAARPAATVAGAVEEAAAGLASVPGDNVVAGAARSAGTAARKAAAKAADQAQPAAASSTGNTTADLPPASTAPNTVADPDSGTQIPTGPTLSVAKAPSRPPTGTTAPPSRPSTAGPARSTPTAAPRPRVVTEPEPIDLLEVAGGAAVTRFAVPAAGAAALLLLVLLVRRSRR